MGLNQRSDALRISGGDELNIVYIIDEFPPFIRGETGIYAEEITKRLPEFDIHPFVISKNNGELPVSDLFRGIPVYRPNLLDISDTLPLLLPDDVATLALQDQHIFLGTVLHNNLAAYHLIQRTSREKGKTFSLVVAHDWQSAIAGILIKRNLKIPLVFHFHSAGYGLSSQTGKTPAVRKIEKAAALMADEIITPSNALKDELIDTGYQPDNIHVIYDGVDTDFYNPDFFSPDSIKDLKEQIGIGEHPMILYIGEFSAVNGVDELLKAMVLVIREVPDAVLVLLGEGEMKEQIYAMTEELGLSDNIILQSRHIPGHERILWYAASDCVVLPSKYRPSGVFCAEAMSMGKAVVVGAAGVSGLRELVVTDGPLQCGYHVNPWDPADIATYTIALLKNQEMSHRLGTAGRERVLEYFTWNITAIKTSHLYYTLIRTQK